MPTETLIAIIAIATPFVIFALVLGWTDFRSRDAGHQTAHPAE